jgi:hypothetical protein
MSTGGSTLDTTQTTTSIPVQQAWVTAPTAVNGSVSATDFAILVLPWRVTQFTQEAIAPVPIWLEPDLGAAWSSQLIKYYGYGRDASRLLSDKLDYAT